MGKKRITTINLDEKEKKAAGSHSSDGAEGLSGEWAKPSPGVAEGEVAGKKKPKASGKKKPPRTRSHRYQTLRKLIKPDQIYPLPKAIDLLKKTANAKFNESVELHLIFHPGAQIRSTPGVEKKELLAHLKIGKVKEDKEKLLLKIKKTLKPFNQPQIKKAVLTSTMGPGIKLDL